MLFLADFMLVAALNPCPCGHVGNRLRACTCSSIAFWFGLGSTNPGELRSIVLSGDLDTLQFEAWKGDSGPLTFDLRREP